MENQYFLGSEAYRANEAEFFPARQDETQRLSYMLDNERVSVLTSDARCGKTSLINAGILSENNLKKKNAAALKFDVPVFEFGAKVLEKQLVDFVSKFCQKPEYIDMSFENDGSLWFAMKRFQANQKDKKRIYLILDSFENFFTYTQASRKEFSKALADLIYGEMPQKINEELQNIMLGKSDTVISKEGMSMIYEPLNISLLFSVSKDKYGSLAELNQHIRGIFQNVMNLEAFDFSTAANAIQIIAKQPFNELQEIEINEKLSDKILSEISFNSMVSPQVLRNAVLFLRNNPQENYFSKNVFSYFTEALEDNVKENFQRFVFNEMVLEGETQPLPAYKTIALKNYSLEENILDKAIKYGILKRHITDDGRIFYLPCNAEIFKAILSLKGFSNQNNFTEIPKIQAFATIEKQKKTFKSQRNKTLVLSSMLIALISVAFVFLAFSLKGDAERSANMAKSNMLTAFAFQKLETDPTFSLRLSQKAVALDTSNIQAYSALLNSFYNTDIFYNITGNLEENVVKSEISSDAAYVLTYVKNETEEKYSARILTADGNIVLQIPHNKEITSITISKDKSKILTTSYDSTARVFDFSGKEILSIKGHKAILWAADFSFDSEKILTAGSDCKVKVWDFSGNCLSTLSGHDTDVYSAKFSPDGMSILTSSGDNTARLWTLDGKLKKVFEIKEDNRFCVSLIISAVFSPDGKYILTASNDYLNKNHKARLWDLEGNELVTFSGHDLWLNSAEFSSDGKYVITSSRDKTVRIFQLNGKQDKVLRGHNSNVWSAMFLPDSKSVISVGDDHTIRTWTPGKRFETYQGAKNINFACFSSNGLNIMAVEDTIAQSWDLTGEITSTFKGHTARINTARYSHNSKYTVTASKDCTVRLWDSFSGKMLKTYTDHKAEVNDAVFSPDDNFLISVSADSTIVIRDLKKEKTIKILSPSGCVTSVSISPQGGIFAIGGKDGKIILYDLAGKILKTFHGHDGRVNSVSFSPNGEYIISTSSDETAVLWDKLGQMRFTFRGYENKVNSAVFSPDSRFVLTTSDDGLAQLWTSDGKDIMKFRHDGKVSSAVFSPDGKYILTVYTDANRLRTIKLRMISPDGITHHIDQLDLYGSVWKPDSATMQKYGMD